MIKKKIELKKVKKGLMKKRKIIIWRKNEIRKDREILIKIKKKEKFEGRMRRIDEDRKGNLIIGGLIGGEFLRWDMIMESNGIDGMKIKIEKWDDEMWVVLEKKEMKKIDSIEMIVKKMENEIEKIEIKREVIKKKEKEINGIDMGKEGLKKKKKMMRKVEVIRKLDDSNEWIRDIVNNMKFKVVKFKRKEKIEN